MVAGEPTVEVLSPGRISPKSIDLQHTLLVGLVSPSYILHFLASHGNAILAKSLVAAGLARRVLVQLSYAIGVAEPLSIYVDTYGTAKKSDEELVAIISKNWDLRPGVIGKYISFCALCMALIHCVQFVSWISKSRYISRLRLTDTLVSHHSNQSLDNC